jgi:hypothetical protein
MDQGPRRRPPPPPRGGRGGRLLYLVLGTWFLVLGCAEVYILDLPDINLEAPYDLPQRLEAFRSGAERWHGDPKAVADAALRTSRDIDVPWKADLYKPSQYTVMESPEWGTYVVRGYVYPSGHLMRYRVKIRPYKEIWYVVQISRYKMHELDDDPAHTGGHRH